MKPKKVTQKRQEQLDCYQAGLAKRLNQYAAFTRVILQ